MLSGEEPRREPITRSDMPDSKQDIPTIRVIVTGVEVSTLDLMALFVKMFIAAIPALVIIGAMILVVFTFLTLSVN